MIHSNRGGDPLDHRRDIIIRSDLLPLSADNAVGDSDGLIARCLLDIVADLFNVAAEAGRGRAGRNRACDEKQGRETIKADFSESRWLGFLNASLGDI